MIVYKNDHMENHSSLLSIKERRLFQRCYVNYISYIYEDNAFQSANVINMSEEGLCVTITRNHKVGETINLKVKCLLSKEKDEMGDAYIYFKGKCIWIFNKGKHLYTAGLRIVSISREDLHKLKNHIQILYLLPSGENGVLA
jgi:hypothetical protein